MRMTATLHGIQVKLQHVKQGKRGSGVAWNLPNDGPGGVASTYSLALAQANAAIVDQLNAACETMVTSV